MLVRDPHHSGVEWVKKAWAMPSSPHVFLLDIHPSREPLSSLTPKVFLMAERSWVNPTTLAPGVPMYDFSAAHTSLKDKAATLAENLGVPVTCFYQPHIKSWADVEKLSRYLRRLAATV